MTHPILQEPRERQGGSFMQERLFGLLERPLIHFPDKVAMIDGDGDRQFTYREFHARVCQLANGLRSIGVGKGDAVTALCMNHHRYLEMYFACHALGAIIVPMNVRLKEAEIIYILNDSQTRVLFIDRPFLPMLAEVRAGSPGLSEVFYSDSDQTPEGLRNYDELLEGQSVVFEPVETDEDDTAGYFYTGGTTGEPKGVMLTGRNLVSNAFHALALLKYTERDRYLHIAPMFHLADAASIYAVTMMGGTHVFGRAFEPKLALELIQNHKVTMLILVPTMLNFLLNHPDFAKYDLSSLRNFLYGASPMPVALLKRAMKEMPCLPIQGYGMTEAAPLVTGLTGEDHKRGLEEPGMEWLLGSAGRTVPGVDMLVVDGSDREVAIGEAGELIVRGPNVMKGYLNKPKATAEAIYKGYYHTGDVAIRQPEGYVTIVDRKKDMIISGGENIYTTEVENVIMQFPAVLETTVIGIPDPTWGETVKAFVVMKPGECSSDIEIIEFCRQRLAHFKCPRSVEFLEALPKSGAGKILKRDLRAAYWGEGKQVH